MNRGKVPAAPQLLCVGWGSFGVHSDPLTLNPNAHPCAEMDVVGHACCVPPRFACRVRFHLLGCLHLHVRVHTQVGLLLGE